MPDAPVDLLQRVPLFSTLDRGGLERLARTFRERRFRAGETVAAEGQGGVGFFLIADGRARVTVRGDDHGELGPGDYFGEVALIDGGPRSATVKAEEDLRCYALSPWDFRPLVESNVDIAWRLVQALAARVRDAEQREP